MVKGSDGYAYLYLYTISATDKANVNSSRFISVPDKVLTTHSGKLMTVEIDLSQITASNQVIGTKDAVIPILTDTGSGASIEFETVVVSSPHTTVGSRLYKIVGIKAKNYGDTPYQDFNLRDSLTAKLTEETASQILEISNAITIGFSPISGINIREILGAKFAAVNLEIDSRGISSSIDQKEFFKFGIFEDVEKIDNTKLFSGDDTGESFSNQLKLRVVAFGTASPTGGSLTVGTNLTLSNSGGSVQKQNSKFVGKKQISATEQDLEVHTTNLDFVQVGGKVKVPKSDEEYTITSVTKPDIKQNSGKTLHIGSTKFTVDDNDVNKRFFAQIIQRF